VYTHIFCAVYLVGPVSTIVFPVAEKVDSDTASGRPHTAACEESDRRNLIKKIHNYLNGC
jgi:hypothetical protein